MSGTDAAATLSLEIKTKPAQDNLEQLKKEYQSLHAEMSKGLPSVSFSGSNKQQINNYAKETVDTLKAAGQQISSMKWEFTPFKAGSGDILAGYKDKVAAQVNDVRAELNSQITKLRATVALFQAQAEKAINASKTQGAKTLSTRLSAGGGSLAGLLALDEGQVKRFNERLKNLGVESVKALDSGWTTSNFSSFTKVLDALERNTEGSLNRIKRMALAAQLTVDKFGTETALSKYGPSLVDGSAAKLAGDRLGLLAREKERSELLASEKAFDAEVTALYARRNQLIQALDVERYEQAAKATARLKSIQESRDKQTYDEEVAKYARRNELIQALDVERYEQAAKATARLKSIQESRDKQVYDEEVAKYARRNELIQALDVERYEQAAKAAAKLKSIQESRDKQLYDAEVAAYEQRLAMERKYILASDAQRLNSAISARKLMDAGYKGNLAQEFAPTTLAMASSTSVKQLETQLRALGGATNASTGHQLHWNQVANEGHAAARGLAGALGVLWTTYGSIVPLVASAALAGSLKSVVTTGKELEYQFKYIQAITGGSAVSMADFSNTLKGSMATPVEAAGGLRVLAQAGLSLDESMKALPSVLKLSTVGEVDLAHAALSATSIMHTFGKSVEDISHIGDVFATAARASATSVKEMMEAMKQAASISNVFGVSMEETAAALATLANRGIEGSAAGTAIRNMVKELSSPATEKAAYALQQYGIQIFNADGSAKKFTQNLQQLSDVTSVMTKETKAKFLEDLFNERGAKAANILLSDLEKMQKVLAEIEMSSKGLGFMTEAQIAISQSTEGMVKELKSSLQTTLGEVFNEVKPQIDSIISSVASLVKSDEFKRVFTSIAESVASLTVVLKDHADVIGAVIAAYAGFKVLSVVGGVVLAFGAQLATLAAATATTTTILGTLGTLLSGPFAIGLVAVGLTVAALAIKYRNTDESLQALVKATLDAGEAQGRLNDSLSSGLAALTKSNDLQAERIRLLREGKSAAESAATAMDNLGYASAKANVVQAKQALDYAKANLEKPEVAGYDINFSHSPAYAEAWDAVQTLTKRYVESQKQLEQSASDTIRAGMRGREKAVQDVQEKAYAEVEIQNKKFEAIARLKSLSETELSEGKFYGKPETVEARKKTLQSNIERGKAAEAFSPLDTRTAESEATQVELARREAFLSENSLAYERKPKAVKTGAGGSSRGALKDSRSILEDNLASGLKQEQTKLGRELIDIETQLAGQTLSASVAMEKKNEATLTTLGLERMRIEASINEAELLGDNIVLKKFKNDLDENTLKIEKQKQQAVLDTTKSMTADSNAIEDSIRNSQRYADNLQFEISLLGKTALETANLRAERERILALEDLGVKVKRNQVNPDVADQEKAAIAKTEEAQKEDAAYRESWLGGWSKAFDEYNKRASSYAQAAQDTFAAMSSSMEDAISTFVTTGKLNFKDFAKSLIADIAKIEAKVLMSKVFGGAGESGGGLLGFIKGAIGLVAGSSGGGGAAAASSVLGFDADTLGNGIRLRSALGNVFSGSPSLHAYVNTVQNSPRTFAYQNLHGFAKGGVFAEAGPEAVMPLMRDSKGRLGVRSQGSGDGRITIINQTTGRIDQVSEKTLSSGERALIIEEAVNTTAAQFANPNSRTSMAMHRTFNLQRNR